MAVASHCPHCGKDGVGEQTGRCLVCGYAAKFRVSQLRPDLNEDLYRVELDRQIGGWEKRETFVTYLRADDLRVARAAISEALND